MATKNCLFEYAGRVHRLLHAEVDTNRAWCIDITDQKALPFSLSLSSIAQLPLATGDAPQRVTLSEKERRLKEQAWSALEPLLIANPAPALFDPSPRKAAIRLLCKNGTCSEPTLYKYLRRYWQGGQVPAALIPRYERCGTSLASKKSSLTEGRGRPSADYAKNYQLTTDDLYHMEEVVEEYLFKDRSKTLLDGHAELLQRHYEWTDGNGTKLLLPLGDRPSARQFRYFYKKNYGLVTHLKAKLGEKEFNLNHRAVIGVAAPTTLGVGQIYEIDATPLESTAVAADDRNIIVGKPTLYLVTCTRSQLVVAYYLGLENASWVAAMQAIYCIAQDKKALCQKYGVEYKPEHWPAHEVLPGEFRADRGSEWTGENSMILVRELGSTATNLPAGRAEMKGTGEKMNDLILAKLRSFELSAEPDAQARKRQQKRRSNNACATIDELNKYVLEVIIARNRKRLVNYKMSPEERSRQLIPTPINIWNDGVANRSGLLSKFTEEQARYLLLPTGFAAATKHGFEFRGCSYLFDNQGDQQLFARARHKGFDVKVSYDPRLVDAVFIHSESAKTSPSRAILSPRSAHFFGYSFAEVEKLEAERRRNNRAAEQDNLQELVDFNKRNRPIARAAFAEMQAAGDGKARKSRRSDIAESRHQERAKERASVSLVAAPRSATVDMDAHAQTPATPSSSRPAPARAGQGLQERIAAQIAMRKAQATPDNEI